MAFGKSGKVWIQVTSTEVRIFEATSKSKKSKEAYTAKFEYLLDLEGAYINSAILIDSLIIVAVFDTLVVLKFNEYEFKK